MPWLVSSDACPFMRSYSVIMSISSRSASVFVHQSTTLGYFAGYSLKHLRETCSAAASRLSVKAATSYREGTERLLDPPLAGFLFARNRKIPTGTAICQWHFPPSC